MAPKRSPCRKLAAPPFRAIIPPLVDTAYLHGFPAKLGLDFGQAVLSLTDPMSTVRGALLTYDGLAELRTEGPGWEIRAGSLMGYGPGWVARFQGRGAFAGVHGMIGRDKPDEAGERPWRVLVMVGSGYLWSRYRHPTTEGRPAHPRLVLGDLVASLTHDVGQPALLAEPIPDEHWRMSRLDICRDMTGYGWQESDLSRFTSQSYVRGEALASLDPGPLSAAVTDEDRGGWVFAGRSGMTLYVGRRGRERRMLRIYNKHAETAVTGKDCYDAVWRMAIFGSSDGIGPLPLLYRVEVEHGGGWLQSHGMETLADYRLGAEVDLWEHYLSETRHVEAGRTRSRRAESSDVWKALLAPWKPAAVWQYVPAPPKPPPNPKYLEAMASGCLANWAHQLAAAHGCDYAQALEYVLEQVTDAAKGRLDRLQE